MTVLCMYVKWDRGAMTAHYGNQRGNAHDEWFHVCGVHALNTITGLRGGSGCSGRDSGLGGGSRRPFTHFATAETKRRKRVRAGLCSEVSVLVFATATVVER